MTTKLYDPYTAARSAIAGGRRFAFFYGSQRDGKLDPHPSAEGVNGTDLLLFNNLGIDFQALHIPKNYFRQPVRHKIDRFDIIFNLVTNPDANAIILKHIERLLVEFPGLVVNHPTRLLQT
jgi:hypothetical protein